VAPAAAPAPREEAPAEKPVAQAAPQPMPAAGEALAAQQAEAVAMLRRAIEQAQSPLRWPMYVRNVKQLMRQTEPGFDERRFGFGGIIDLLRAAQRDSVLRLERDRQGVLRVFPGTVLQKPAQASAQEPQALPLDLPSNEVPVVDAQPVEDGELPLAAEAVEAVETPRHDEGPAEDGVAGNAVDEPVTIDTEPAVQPKPAARRRRSSAAGRKTAPAKKPRATAAVKGGRGRKTAKTREE